jgi:hypothetical protein
MRIPAPSVLFSGTLATARGAVVNMKRPHVRVYSNCKFWISSKSVWWKYEGGSINRSQMDIERKTCDIRAWKKYLFLDMSSTNISVVGIATTYGLDDRGVGVRVPVGTIIFSSPHPPDRLQWVPGGSFPGGKAAGAWSWPLTSNYCRGQENVDLYASMT